MSLTATIIVNRLRILKNGGIGWMDRILTQLLPEIYVAAEKMQADYTDVLVFGASADDLTSLRHKIISRFPKSDAPRWPPHYFAIHTAEAYVPRMVQSFNLLEMENVLAEAVDAIIICPESRGSVAELGAFANSELLIPKLFVVNDRQFKREKSFINRGPIKHITQRDGLKHLFWVDPRDDSDVDNAISGIIQNIDPRDSASGPSSLRDLFFLRQWLLLALYIADIVMKEDMVCFLQDSGLHDARLRFDIAVSSLLKTGEIGPAQKAEPFRLTSHGLHLIRESVNRASKNTRHKIDRLRIKVLNSMKNRETTA